MREKSLRFLMKSFMGVTRISTNGGNRTQDARCRQGMFLMDGKCPLWVES